ncbi:Nn.00g006350.m01.CDS01 [Neocucurbitaria sp. VM-36]
MPQKFPWSKSNRSHNSVDTPSSGQPSPVPSGKGAGGRPIVRAADEHALAVNNDVASQRYPPAGGQQAPPQTQQPPVQQQQIPAGVSQEQFRQQQQQQFPQRSTSQANRLSAHLDQVPQNYQQQPGPPQPSPGLDQNRRSYQPQSSPQVYVQEPKKQSLRSRIAAGLTGHKDDDSSKQAQKNGVVGRRQSVRKSGDPRLQEYQSQEGNRLHTSQQWHQQQGSSPHLPTSSEQDEDNLDPFLQQDGHDTPQVPPKDLQYQQIQQQQQQFAPNSRQEQYSRPPLGRVSTEGSYQAQGGVDHYSPDQHQGQGLQQPPQQQQTNQQQQYQSYQPVVQHPQNPNEYQAFNPQNVPSPLLGNAQLHGQGQELTQQQKNYYQYQQQQAPQQVQGQSPQDNSPQNIHYQQQQQFVPQPQPQPQPQPHKGQDLQQQQPQTIRPPSQQQQQPELQHPQATRQHPQIVQQGQHIDTQHLQQLRPPSSQQQLAPPSPLQPQPYQTYDAQQGKHPQPTDPHAQNTTPPQQGQDNMAPSGQGNARNTLRKVNDGGQQQPGAPSRESSLLQQAPAQGQPLGQPPVSPGIASFDANVVPTASQGQPYRGEKGQQGHQGGEMGRATPPPRSSATDMTDEEIEKMMKEHEVLREKYQKVKRYFFEQQTQVHQLQNTLANQRLSLSRTSWDDSEYATRFNRLDGLIAQLSFSIRKDWKSIPHWLHVVVNKTAVETGKQEMTAVGRAFISHWLVENIFEKYFHPDLEPGFSTQLQSIALNIRKFSPTCHSAEDEESLAAKIINWRLATLEGLADLLRAPQAATNRQTLTETLNEKLIASLQMHLNDPAPPDLNGGVPMIVELAISIAQHLPLESREVHIEYFPPGHGIVSEFMKIETGIPALTAPITDPDEADRASLRSVASKVHDDNASIAEQEQQAQQQQAQPGGQPPKEDKKRGMFGFGGSKKPTAAPASLGKRESSLGQGGSQQSLTQNPPGSSGGPKDEPPPPRVRLAVGVAVQIRGKSILMKAPVYST